MSDADLGFSMRMEGDDAVPTPPVDMFAVRPDRKGPKTVAILIIFGALLLAYQAYGDYLYHTAALRAGQAGRGRSGWSGPWRSRAFCGCLPFKSLTAKRVQKLRYTCSFQGPGVFQGYER